MDFRWMAAACAAMIVGGASAQDAVQWRVENGGNGHWYEARLSTLPIGWLAASSMAESVGGHLATPTSGPENSFILGTIVPRLGSFDGFGPILGGRFVGGAWTWVTGEPWAFTAWGEGEPSSPTAEPFLHYQRPDFGWNDYDGSASGYGPPFRAYIVEWSSDCDGDGVIDFGQILSGQSADSDGNGVPDVCELGPCPGDVTGNGSVNGLDLAAILAAWGSDGSNKFDCDIDNDGVVSGSDLAFVLAGWGVCP
jgi:hypothetical protein